MAKSLKLANWARDQWVDLLNGALRMQSGTRAASEDTGLVEETMELFGAASDITIIRTVREFNAIREKIRQYFTDPLSNDPQWLEEHAKNEPERRSLLYGLRYDAINQRQLSSQLLGRQFAKGVLTLQRSAIWESAAASTIEQTGLSGWGGMWRIYGIEGDLPARLWKTIIYGDETLGSVTRIWLGMRRSRYGMKDFVSVWELEHAAPPLSYDTSETVDANASGGEMLEVDFATRTDMALRTIISVADVVSGTPDLRHFIGKYLVLLRCKVSSSPTTEVAVQMRHGMVPAAPYEENSIPADVVYVSNTSYDLVPLGIVQIPPDGFRSGDPVDMAELFSISIYAERVTGNSSSRFDMDALVLIPAEHLLTIEKAQVTYLENSRVEAITREDGEQIARGYTDGSPGIIVEPGFDDWQLPEGDVLAVAVCAGAGAHSLTNTLHVEMNYVPRWYNYRS